MVLKPVIPTPAPAWHLSRQKSPVLTGERKRARLKRLRQGSGWGAGIALTLVSTAVLGYHPYAEDGGLYLAEVKHKLDPAMFPHAAEFVAGHLGAGVFGFLVAGAARATGLSIDVVMVLLQVLCAGGVLLGVWLMARCCYPAPEARAGAVGLVALAMGMPVAGTSLMLMDPYVTARSMVTALVALGLGCLVASERRVWAAAAFCAAIMVHPLMGGFGAGAAVVLLCLMHPRRSVRRGGICMVAVAALSGAWCANASAPSESAEYVRVVATRYYWFLAQWHWYEWLGLAGPMAILAGVAARGRGTDRYLARMCVVVGGCGVGVAALFAREDATVHAVARLQPLRCFQVVYLVMLLVLGARIGTWGLRRSAWRWGLAAAMLAGGMFATQRQTYPASGHLELPGMLPRNLWEQAFIWVREQTPRDALFALDADYVHLPGEDVQGFRAIAERSALPDYSKDGGQVSIRPKLSAAWTEGQRVQARLTGETDVERTEALHGTAVSWVVLGREAVTSFACPYRNGAVIVCQVPAPSAPVRFSERYNRR